MVLTNDEQTAWVNLKTRYTTLVENRTTYKGAIQNNRQQIQDLKGALAQLSALTAQKAQLDQAESTFEQEFQERLDAGEGPGSSRLERAGITTFQDLVLAIFFSSIGLMILSLVVYALLYSSKKVVATASFLAIGGVVIALLMAILIRFG